MPANYRRRTFARIAEAFLKQGVRYVCTWGTDCERVHDIFDEMYARFSESRNFSLIESKGRLRFRKHRSDLDGGKPNSVSRE
jgi:hypothetical protein